MQQCPQSGSGVGGVHQQRADQEGIESGVAQLDQLDRFPDARLRHQHESGLPLQQPGEFEGRVQIHVEGSQVPVVDPDDAGSALHRRLQFEGIVDFHQSVELEVLSGPNQFPEPFRREARGDQETGGRAVRPRFRQLIGIEDEVLPQQGQPRLLLRDGADELEIAVEEMLFGQDRDGRRPIVQVEPADLPGRKPAGERSAAGALILDLGDDVELRTSQRRLEGGSGRAGARLQQLGQGNPGPSLLQVLFLPGQDPIQHRLRSTDPVS